jgi:carbon monoxide dehydrogenase subunit G
MPSVSRTFTVTAPPDQVIDYLKDFSNAERWDPGTVRCTRTDSGPVKVGSSWHNVSKIVGVTTELSYTLKELTDTRLVFEGKNKSATATDNITVTPAAGGSQIDYRADLQMHGLAKVLAPAMQLVFEKIAGDTREQMVKVLNGLSV